MEVGGDEELDILDLDQIEGPPVERAQHLSKCLVGKLLSDKAVNSYAIMDVMKRAWKAKKGMDAREWTNNLFLFKFEDPTEMNWVIKNQPWHFEGHLFTIRQLRDKEQPSSISINEAHLWVRIYDAPTSCMAKAYARAMAKKLGKLVDFDPNHDFFGKYIRIKVKIDITKPLKRGLLVVVGGVKMWLPIKYEGLPLFCYHCGMIGHMFRACDELDHKEEQNPKEMAYGPDIKASPMKKVRQWPPKNASPRAPHPNPSLSYSTKPSTPSTDFLVSLGSSTHKQIPNLEPMNSIDISTHKKQTSPCCIEPKNTPSATDPSLQAIMDIDLHTFIKPQKTQLALAKTNLLATLPCQQTSTPPKMKNKNKKEWKRLARGKLETSAPTLAKEERGKRPLYEDGTGKMIELVEAKRLKFLALNVENEPMA